MHKITNMHNKMAQNQNFYNKNYSCNFFLPFHWIAKHNFLLMLGSNSQVENRDRERTLYNLHTEEEEKKERRFTTRSNLYS